MDHYLSKAQINDYRLKVVAKLETLSKLASQSLSEATGKQESVVDAIDRGCQSESQSTQLALANRQAIQVTRIRKFLKDFDVEEYGYCCDCGEEIGTQRLDSQPDTNHCSECANLNELKSKNK